MDETEKAYEAAKSLATYLPKLLAHIECQLLNVGLDVDQPSGYGSFTDGMIILAERVKNAVASLESEPSRILPRISYRREDLATYR